MRETGRPRTYDQLTAPDVSARLSRHSVLVLPIGSTEQHGPHLPLNTDTVIAERFAQMLVGRYGDHHDLWALPALPYGLSPEHAWSAGVVSLKTTTFSSLLDTIVGQYVSATTARRLLIVNGHGGNRGVLETLAYELQQTYGIAVCVINPVSLSPEATVSELPEIHAGVRETSMMLALAPDMVHLGRIPADHTPDPGRREEIQRLILRRGTAWPWSSCDPAISSLGIIGGDPRKASAAAGHSIIASAVDAGAEVLARLAAPNTDVPDTLRRTNVPHL
ncbi:creatininase family protein [Streptomyces stelliscabiei]|uniref:Creatinine amidohydrolase n=1 Tax=Streptomyces stelliscabiei TaxID=146820 RepID=A0A8I0P5L6_9ACTN|nr:creatininase family protein [Streptomyces stelliscabiei]MBE1599968.1 creatinine amidohydrolase [Streptomyces stelliscabiei]